MNCLKKKVQELKRKGATGVSFFITGGYPDMSTFIDIIKEFDRLGCADFLEIGIPFSDPLADGPVIQYTSRQAIDKGAELEKILESLSRLKKDIELPLVLMSYLNPLIAPGLKKSLMSAREAGISAVIIPDLPAGEHPKIEEEVQKSGLGHIFLASPLSSQKRIREISEKSSPFLYYVSSFGTTGSRKRLDLGLGEKLKQARKISQVPVYCGFGISKPSQALELKDSLDGIIIGSAFLEKIKGKDFKAPLKFAISIGKSLGRM